MARGKKVITKALLAEVSAELERRSKPEIIPNAEHLLILQQRFYLMAEVRRKEALELRSRKDVSSAIALCNTATAYERCASELARVCDEQTPPEPGEPREEM